MPKLTMVSPQTALRRKHYAARVLQDGRLVAPGNVQHGTEGTYHYRGCRCVPCTAAHREAKRERNAKLVKIVDGKRIALLPESRHGRSRAWNELGCQCGICLAARRKFNDEQIAERRARRLAKPSPQTQQERRQRRREQRVLVNGVWVAPVPHEKHGREYTYREWSCRCHPCRDAAMEAKRRRKREKWRAGQNPVRT